MVHGHSTRRKSGGFGEPGYRYSYNGATRDARPWPRWLVKIKNTLQERFQQRFEFALINYFPDLLAAINPHSDNERDMERRSIIACISLGHTYLLSIQRLNREEFLKVELPSASLYTMEGQFQEFLLHGVQAKAIVDSDQGTSYRFSITFRHLIHPDKISLAPLVNKKSKKRHKPEYDSNSRPQLKKLTHKTNSGSGPDDINRPGSPQ